MRRTFKQRISFFSLKEKQVATKKRKTDEKKKKQALKMYQDKYQDCDMMLLLLL